MALIDIEIDEETPCLVHRVSGETYQTEFARLTFDDLEQVGEEAGWIGFDWRFYLEDKNFEVYKLLVQGDNAIQGIVCLGVRGSWVEVYLVENAPWNIGRERQEFRGVGLTCSRLHAGVVSRQVAKGTSPFMRKRGWWITTSAHFARRRWDLIDFLSRRRGRCS